MKQDGFVGAVDAARVVMNHLVTGCYQLHNGIELDIDTRRAVADADALLLGIINNVVLQGYAIGSRDSDGFLGIPQAAILSSKVISDVVEFVSITR